MSDRRDANDANGDHRLPGWVIVIGAVGFVLVALLIVANLLGIDHGPGLHAP